jgi:SWI/SNF-related matrix-associated actin-dependent regulator 1 of chromatin subfamily A
MPGDSMQVTYHAGLYRCPVNACVLSSETLTKAGWRLHPSKQFWFTSRVENAANFHEQCVGEAKQRVDAWMGPRTAAIAASCALDSDLDIPAPPGKVYRPYQRAGIAFMHAHRNVLNADAMRLGKTIQAIGTLNMEEALQAVLVICPATAKEHWVRTWQQWRVHPLEAAYCEGDHNPETPFLVINYDILDRHNDYLKSIEWDAVICDESRALKNERAGRTQIVLGKRGVYAPLRAGRWMFLDGTPDPVGRPIDLWTICKKCDPNGLGANWWEYVHRYCGAHNDGFGLKTNGATHLEELQFKMRSAFMIRREKSDVAQDIAPNRQTIVLPQAGLEPLLAEERNIVRNNLADFEEMLANRGDEHAVTSILEQMPWFDGVERDDQEVPEAYAPVASSMSSVRRELAIQKCGMCVEWIKDNFKDGTKVIIFAHHRDVVAKLKRAFPNAAVVIGGMSSKKRWEAIDRFTNDPECHHFIGNIQAAGQAINLSVADDVVFVEVSWVPGEMDQAEERAWEVGKTNPVSVWRLVVEDSLDEIMCGVLDKRQKDITKTMSVSALKGVKA